VKVDLGPWRRIPVDGAVQRWAAASGEPGIRAYQRDLQDGHLTAFAALATWPAWDGPRWHLSISHRTSEEHPQPGRYPDWDEIADARYRFLPGDIHVAMLMPPRSEYVNIHATCFHLWQCTDGGSLPAEIARAAS
jgi:hypothetical protein